MYSALDCFSNNDLRNWLQELGIETIVGSSNKIYPKKGIKPIQVLDLIKERIISNNVDIRYKHNFIGYSNDNQIEFNNQSSVKADIIIFGLGGGSWSVTGSDGNWLNTIQKMGITTTPFVAQNCGFKTINNEQFLIKWQGNPLKNITIEHENIKVKGEIVFTREGVEGNAIYAHSYEIQKKLNTNKQTLIHVDLKPMNSENELLVKLQNSSERTITNKLKKALNLNSLHIELIKNATSKDEYLALEKISAIIKKIPISIHSSFSMDEAISTSGGIHTNELNENFELKKRTTIFCIGEMVNWNAPTGGYLLQGCFSMGVKTAHYLNTL